MNSDELLTRYQSSKDFWRSTHASMMEFRNAYNGDNPVVLDQDKVEPQSVPNLHQQGLDHLSQAIASVVPHIAFPPLRPGIKTSEKNANGSAKTMRWWWERNNMRAILRQRARYLPGYGLSAVLIVPDAKWGFARWEVRDPLCTFPAPTTDPTQVIPEFCFFTYNRSLAWLRQHYPEAIVKIHVGGNPNPNDLFEVLEYVDDKERHAAVIGKPQGFESGFMPGTARMVTLARADHGLDYTPVAVARRHTLDRLQGHFDGIMEMTRLQAMLMTLAVIGAKRSVYAEPWLEGDGSAQPKILKKANALTGDVGIVQNGRLRFERPDANFTTIPMINLLERNQRVGAGIPAQWGGENPNSSTRTGRASEVLIDSTIESAVMEYREALEDSLAAECGIAVDIAKRFFGSTSRTFYLKDKRGGGKGDYKPDSTFETNEARISYAHPSWDSARMVIEAAQRTGSGLMSKRTAMEMDPLIADPEAERDRITSESLRDAALASLQTMAANGQIPPADVARIAELVESDREEWWDAIQTVQKEAQERQSTTVDPVEPGSPEAQPGLAPPGMGAEAGMIPGPTEDQTDLASLIRTMRTTRNELNSQVT